MRKTIVVLLVCFLSSAPIAMAAVRDGFGAKVNVYADNVRSEYAHDPAKGLPEISFFPAEEAKWNGYKVLTVNWKELTDFQKAAFINEGIIEIEKKKKVIIKCDNRARLIEAMARTIDILVVQNRAYEKVTAIQLMEDILRENGMTFNK